MFAMFKQLWATIALYFAALEKVASAANHLGTWCDETSAAFADEARIERSKKLATLKGELKAIEAKAAKPGGVAIAA